MLLEPTTWYVLKTSSPGTVVAHPVGSKMTSRPPARKIRRYGAALAASFADE